MREVLSTYLEFKELYRIAEVVLEKAESIISQHQLMQLTAGNCKKHMAIMKKSFDKSQMSEYTINLKALDDARNDIYKGLYTYVKSYLNLGSNEQKKAAAHLMHILRPFGLKITKQSYDVETVSIQNILDLLSEAESAKALSEIMASTFVENLRAIEAEFKNLIDESNSKEVKEVYYFDTREAFSNLNRNLSYLLNSLNILLEGAPSDELKTACDAINEYIADIMAHARSRKTRKENKKDGTTEKAPNEYNTNGDNI